MDGGRWGDPLVPATVIVGLVLEDVADDDTVAAAIGGLVVPCPERRDATGLKPENLLTRGPTR